MDFKMHEREPGLHKDDIIAIIRTYDEEAEASGEQ